MKNGHGRQPKQQPLFKIQRPQKPGPSAPRQLPDWLRQQIEQQDPATFGKYAQWKICPKCQNVTLAGWDAYDDYAGYVVTDPAQLDTAAELDATLAGRHTFELRTDSEGKKTLSRRDSHRIRASHATNHPWPVLPEHRCHTAPLGTRLEPRNLNGK